MDAACPPTHSLRRRVVLLAIPSHAMAQRKSAARAARAATLPPHRHGLQSKARRAKARQHIHHLGRIVPARADLPIPAHPHAPLTPPAPTPLPRRDADFIGCLETPRACGEGDGPCDGPCTRRWPMGATVGWDGAWRPPRRAASRDDCMRSLRLGWLAARTIFSNLTEATAEPASYRYWRASEGGLLVLSIRSGCLDPFSLSISCGADAQRRATLIPVRPTQDGIVNQGPSLAVRAPPCPSEGG
jgi:hypothetical protein